MNFAERVVAWAGGVPSIKGLVLIGSRSRDPRDTVWRADAQSDWDFQIITTRPDSFKSDGWARDLGLQLRTYVVRNAAIGGVPKVAAIFDGVEADFVVLPARTLFASKILVGLGAHLRSARLQHRLRDLALIIRPGWHFLLGAKRWDSFYHKIVADISDPRLDDTDVRVLADSFVCDALWTARKITRGEWLAAQRMLHRSLVETNFRLLHELRLRRNLRSFPEARRVETVASSTELDSVLLSAVPTAMSLREGLDKVSRTCRHLTRSLVGDTWQWPDL